MNAFDDFLKKQGTGAWGRSEAAGLANVLTTRWIQIQQAAQNSGVLNPSERVIFEQTAPVANDVIRIMMNPVKAKGVINAVRDWYDDQAASVIYSNIPNVNMQALPNPVKQRLQNLRGSGGYQPSRQIGG